VLEKYRFFRAGAAGTCFNLFIVGVPDGDGVMGVTVGGFVTGDKVGACVTGDEVGACVTGDKVGACVTGDEVGACVTGGGVGACVTGGEVGEFVIGAPVEDGVVGIIVGVFVDGDKVGAFVLILMLMLASKNITSASSSSLTSCFISSRREYWSDPRSPDEYASSTPMTSHRRAQRIHILMCLRNGFVVVSVG
jgi:hypothetical protein